MKKKTYKYFLLTLSLMLKTKSSWGADTPSPPHDIYSYIELEEKPLFNSGTLTLFAACLVALLAISLLAHQKRKKRLMQTAKSVPPIQERLEALNPDWKPENNKTPYKQYCGHLDKLLREKIALISQQQTKALTHKEMINTLSGILNNVEHENMVNHLSKLNQHQFLPPKPQFQSDRHELYQTTFELISTLEKNSSHKDHSEAEGHHLA